MEISKLQTTNIRALLDAFNEEIMTRKKGIKYGTERLEELHKAGFHIEAIIIDGQLLEHVLKIALHACRLERQVSQMMELPDPIPYGKVRDIDRFNKQFNGDFKDQPFGYLIGLLREASNETDLCKRLSEFNTFRKELVHHSFDGTKEVEEMDKKADEYSTSNDLSQLIMDTMLLVGKIQDRVKNLRRN